MTPENRYFFICKSYYFSFLFFHGKCCETCPTFLGSGIHKESTEVKESKNVKDVMHSKEFKDSKESKDVTSS